MGAKKRRIDYAKLSSVTPKEGERTVRMTAPDGTYDVPVSQAQRAESEGWHEETPEEAAARDTRARIAADPIIAAGSAAASALRGATLGLSDLGLAAVAPGDYAEGARGVEGLREVGGGLATAAEVVGSIAPAVLTGGASLAATGAKTAATTGARVAQAALRTAAAGAAEGAVYGGATATLRELGEERLASDPSGSAARILADVGLYGVMGGALGGALGGGARLAGDALSGGAAAVARRTAGEAGEAGGSRSARDWLSSVADEQARVAVAGRAGRDLGEGVGERLIREGVDLSDPATAAVQLGKLADEADLRRIAATQGSDVRVPLSDLRASVVQLTSELDPTLVSTDAAKAVRKAAKPLEELIEAASVRGTETIDLPRLAKLSADMRKAGSSWQSRAGGGVSADAKKAVADLGQRFDDLVSEYLDQAATTSGTGGGAAYREARRDMALFLRAKNAAEKHASFQAKAMPAGNILDTTMQSGMGAASVMGAIVSGNPAALAGLALPFAQRVLRERGASIAARLAYTASRGEMRIGQVADRMLGKPGLAIQQLARRANDAGADLTSAAGGVARAASRSSSWQSRYQELAAPVMATRDDPQGTQQRIAEGLSGVAEVYPELAAELAAQTTGGLTALASRLPASVARPSLTPAATDAVMSPEAQRDFVRAAEAMADPEAAIDAIEAGDASWLDLQALREGQPQLWTQIRMALVERVQEMRTELPFERRVTVGLAFELPGADYSLDPMAGASLQAMQAPPQGEPPQRSTSRLGPTHGARIAGQLAMRGDRAAQRVGGRNGSG